MELAEIIQRLTSNGWAEKSISDLLPSRLNAGVKAHLSYRDRLSFRYHPEEGFIRLMIYGAGDERCLQIDYGDKLDQVLDHIISTKDDLSLGSYLGHYLAIQSICPVSILMVEQLSVPTWSETVNSKKLV